MKITTNRYHMAGEGVDGQTLIIYGHFKLLTQYLGN